MPPTAIRAIVGRFSARFSRQALEQVLQKHPFEFCADLYGGDAYEPLVGVPPERQQYFQSAEIRKCLYRGVDWNALAPLDEELITEMRDCEAVFMSVLTRLEQKKSIPYLTRKLWYLRHLQFWNDYISRHKINLYLSAWIPHEIPDIVIYFLCKARGIPVLYFDITVFPDISVPGHDVRKAGPAIEKRYHELLSARDERPIELGEPFASYEKALVSEEGKPPPLESVRLPTYWRNIKELLWSRPARFLGHAVRYATPAGWVRAGEAVRRWRFIRETDAFYAAHAEVPDLTQPFVYVPLHYQPEAATVPMGGVFADQILMVRMLSALLPDGVFLYVKEHPHRSSWLNRSPDYYRDFLELRKVRLIPPHFSTFQLREHCKAVATITGSAGFEALFRGKPVFLFGSCYYQYAKGVFPIRSVEDCKRAVHAVFEQREAPSQETTHLYLKAMQDTCVPGVPDPWYLKITKFSEEHHTKAMAEGIDRELTAMLSAIATVAS